MFLSIVGKEFRSQILNTRFHVSLILTFGLLVPGTAVLISEHGRQARDMNPYMSEGFYTWGGSWYWLNRQIPVLRSLCAGLGANMSLRASGAVFQGPVFISNYFINNPLQFLFSDLDFAFVINVVGSLLAIVFTYDAISGEREAGTLRLILANSVSRSTILAGKCAGCFLSFVMSILPALVGTAIVLLMHPDISLNGIHWLSVLYMLFVSLLYLAILFMFGIFVSTITRHPRTTLAVLLVLWIVLVLVIPNFSPWLAARLSPVRSVYEVEEEIMQSVTNAAQESYREAEAYAKSVGDNWTPERDKRYGELLGMADRDFLLRRAENVVNARRAFMDEVQRQAEVSRWLSLASPSASFTLLMSDAANTGMESEWNFRRSAFRYRLDYNRFIVKELAAGSKNVTRRIDKTRVPSFTHLELRLEQVSAKHFPSFLTLLIYAVLLLICPQVAFNRMQR
jgi:ABC-type transport system involved in multi-copper enzyme maturation permease subunit